MAEITVKTISAKDDLKKLLLGQEYDQQQPVKNILKARTSNVHIEKYEVVEDVFLKLTGKATEHKDIMNSFWTTYKIMLQLVYPNFFRPAEVIGENQESYLEKPSEQNLLAVNSKYPPHDSGASAVISDRYLTYFDQVFPDYLPNPVPKKYTWNEFLLDNFTKFERVHQDPQLKRFAELTHSIGNITVVPIGFNSGRSLSFKDYWDYSLEQLSIFLASFHSWESYVHTYEMQPFLNEQYQPVALWKNHLKKDSFILPQNIEEINEYLVQVNQRIEKRGQRIVNRL